MSATLTAAREKRKLDVDQFMDIWPLLTSRDLLQALEGCAGKTVSVLSAGAPGEPGHVEFLVDHDGQRAMVDSGAGGKWGQWVAQDPGARLVLEDGAWELSGTAVGAEVSWRAR